MHLSATTQFESPAARWRTSGLAALLLLAVAFATYVLFDLAGGFLIEPDSFTIMVVSMFFFGLLTLAAGYGRDRAQRTKWIVLITWCALLVSQEVFNYRSNVTTVSDSEFATEAYGEAILWIILCAGVIATVFKYPHFLKGLFEGDNKWMTWLTLLSVASCAMAPSPLFSLAWAFKLVLAVIIVHLCSYEMSELNGIRCFLNVTLWGVLLLVLLPTVRSILEPDPVAGANPTGGLELRFLHETPTEISALAGLLLILCLTLYIPKQRRYPLWIAGVSFVLMIIAGGKTGIVAGFMSGILFYAMQKRVKAAIGFTALVTVGIGFALVFTPLGEYAAQYIKLDQLTSFTGRTGIWAFAWPLILAKPIIGHGFYSSRFISMIYPGMPIAAIHLHNSVLETAYNNGAIGLFLMTMVLVVIARNLWKTIHSNASKQLRYLAIGCLAAYVNLFVNGMFNANFGSRPFAPYMILIALVAVSTQLLRISRVESERQLAISAAH